MGELMPIVDRLKDWNASIILIASVIILVLYVGVQLKYPGFYRSVIYRMFVENFSGRPITRNIEVASVEGVSVIISLLSISTMIFAVICYSDMTKFELEYGGEWKVMLIVLLVFSFYNQLKGLLTLFFGKLFRLQVYAVRYNTLILDTERFLGLIFVPLFAFCPFVPDSAAKYLIWTAAVATLILVGFQFVTFFFHLLKNNFLNHYSILYFCALEVLPILIFVKLVF